MQPIQYLETLSQVEHDNLKAAAIHLRHQRSLPHKYRVTPQSDDELDEALEKLDNQIIIARESLEFLKNLNLQQEAQNDTPED